MHCVCSACPPLPCPSPAARGSRVARCRLSLRFDPAQRVSRSGDRDALIHAEIEQIQIARDDKVSASRESTGEHVIVIGIAAGGCRQRLRLDDVRKAPIVLDEVGSGESREMDSMRELLACNDLSELGHQNHAGAQCERTSAGQIDQAARRAAQSRPDRTVLVSATMIISARYADGAV
jgi:hypothetical protein